MMPVKVTCSCVATADLLLSLSICRLVRSSVNLCLRLMSVPLLRPRICKSIPPPLYPSSLSGSCSYAGEPLFVVMCKLANECLLFLSCSWLILGLLFPWDVGFWYFPTLPCSSLVQYMFMRFVPCLHLGIA